MPKNRVQFKRGMSLGEFMARYGTPEQCEQALFCWRWPPGFVCPGSGHTGYCSLLSRRLFQCHRCGRQTLVTADRVQLDDACWGGRRRCNNRGRGTRGKTPFVAAVEIDEAGDSCRMSPNCLKGSRSKEIARWSRAKLTTGTAVHSDGPACSAAVSEAGCTHAPTVMSGPGLAQRRQTLNWIDAMHRNVKNAIPGRELSFVTLTANE